MMGRALSFLTFFQSQPEMKIPRRPGFPTGSCWANLSEQLVPGQAGVELPTRYSDSSPEHPLAMLISGPDWRYSPISDT